MTSKTTPEPHSARYFGAARNFWWHAPGRLALCACLLAAFGTFGCSGGASDASDPNACRDLDNGIPLCGPSSVEMPLEPGSSSPVIMARIDGREARVLIDTGAQDPIVSSSW